MKVPLKTQGFKAILAVFIFTGLAVSCSKSGTTPDPPVVTYVKPAVAIKPAEKIAMTSATIVAKVVPNEAGTKVSFQYKEGSTDWASVALPNDFSGKDSVTVTSDLISLKSWTEYSFRVVASNKGGDVTSAERKFTTGIVTDVDGNVYGVTIIGTQIWLTSDLKTTHYRDGSVIPNITDNAAWSKLNTGAMCYYNNDSKNTSPLYNWYAATDSRNLAPGGWHVATHADWVTLRVFLGGETIAGGKLKSLTNWKAPNTGANNSTGFNAIPSSIRSPDDGTFWDNDGAYATWLAVQIPAGNVAYVSYDDAKLETQFVFNAQYGAAVRCVKD